MKDFSLRSTFARVLGTRPRIGVAFGSGGARGWAHVGVVVALQEYGVHPACLAGSSIGAIVAALWSQDRMDEALNMARDMNPGKSLAMFLEFKMNRGGLFSGEKAMRTLSRLLLAENFSELPIPVAAVATDLDNGEAVVLKTGSLLSALRASFAIPGIFVPAVTQEGRVLIDGAYSDPVPVDAARRLGADFVIAVNVAGNEPCPYTESEETGESHHGIGNAGERIRTFLRENGWFESARKDDEAEKWRGGEPGSATVPESKSASIGFFDVMLKSLRIAENRLSQMHFLLNPPDLLIQPPVADIATMDFNRARDAIRAGYDAAVQALEKCAALRPFLQKQKAQRPDLAWLFEPTRHP